ncbi:YkvA family protein [uncultured Shewanella sp.]|uniref:YkvA family protein n=1 Tax=Shewanella atlantica TaxID=271099 RepID=UPI0026282C2F|nr:YkvA family protein [uncultured Shewanella sp.]
MSDPNKPGSEDYSDHEFWLKVKQFAKKAGREVIDNALCLYYAAQRPDTPKWAKTVIFGALAYFIAPLDAIPDLTPFVGFTDDLGALAAALAMVSIYVDDDVEKQAADKSAAWFD